MIYKSVISRIRELINTDSYQTGDAIPAEKMLAQQLQVSRMTVRKAIEVLIREGLLQRIHGSGTYILMKDVEFHSSTLNSFVEQMQEIGRQGANEVIEFSIMASPPAIAQQLRISTGERVYYLQRLRYVDGKPYELEDSYMPFSLFPDLSIQHLQYSKFAYIESKGYTIAGCYKTFSPILADCLAARLLNISPKAPLQQITSLAVSSEGVYVDLSIMLHNTNEYHVSHFIRRVNQIRVDS